MKKIATAVALAGVALLTAAPAHAQSAPPMGNASFTVINHTLYVNYLRDAAPGCSGYTTYLDGRVIASGRLTRGTITVTVSSGRHTAAVADICPEGVLFEGSRTFTVA